MFVLASAPACLTPSSTPTERGFITSKLSFVAPFVPQFVRRRVSQFGFKEASTTAPAPKTAPVSPTGHARSWSSDMAGSGAVTPPPSYSETLAPILTPLKFARKMATKTTGIGNPVAERPACSTKVPTGIMWKCVSTGVSLLTEALRERNDLDSSAPVAETAFTRQLFINGLIWLLRALPKDLTKEETTALSAALPTCLIPEPIYQQAAPPMVHMGQHGSYFPAQGPYPFQQGVPTLAFPTDRCMNAQRQPHPGAKLPSTLLYRTTSFVVAKSVLVLVALVPWVRAAASAALRFNKQHRVAERMFSSTLTTADLAARGTLAASAALVALQSGPLGRFAEAAVAWLVRCVGGGVLHGLGEGAVLLDRLYEQERRKDQQQFYAVPHASTTTSFVHFDSTAAPVPQLASVYARRSF